MDIGCQRVRYCVFYDVTRGLHLIKITYDCNYRRIEVKRLNQSRQVRCRNFFIYVNLCYRINGVTQRLIVVFEVWFNVELFGHSTMSWSSGGGGEGGGNWAVINLARCHCLTIQRCRFLWNLFCNFFEPNFWWSIWFRDCLWLIFSTKLRRKHKELLCRRNEISILFLKVMPPYCNLSV